MLKLKALFAAVALAFAPFAASAVTLVAGTDVAEGLNASSSFTYVNDVEPLAQKISGFTLTFNNSNAASILNASSFTFTNPAGVATTTNFSAISLGSGFFAFAAIPNFNVGVGEQFTIAFDLAQPGTSGSFSFDVAPIPLPAAGWMLISALGGMGLLARARNKQAA